MTEVVTREIGWILAVLGVVLCVPKGWELFTGSHHLKGKKVRVFLGRVHWLGYSVATDRDQDRLITDQPIEVPVGKEVPFVFGIANLNAGVPLKDALLKVIFRREDRLTVRAHVDGQPEHRLWREHEANIEYWYPFPAVHDEWRHSWNPLHVTFPRSLKYGIRFEITGEGLKKVTAQAFVIVRVRKGEQ